LVLERRCEKLKLLDFAWNTVTSLSQRDFDSLRLILDEALTYPALSSDKRGYVIKLPVPHAVNDKFYTLQGLFTDQDSNSWGILWRLFKASLYHTALHAAYSDFARYAAWAKGKDLAAATYAVSLVEDYHVTAQAAKRWPGVLHDIAYANYVAGLRALHPEEIADIPSRTPSELLLSLWGINRRTKNPTDEQKDILSLALRIRGAVETAVGLKAEERKNLLLSTVQDVYSQVYRREQFSEIPFLPHTEAHGKSSLFDSKLVERADDTLLLTSSYQTLGLEFGPSEALAKQESVEAFLDMKSTKERQEKIRASYERATEATRLESVEFPKGDYGMYLRVKSALAGPIRNVRDQLRTVKNALDDTGGHHGGQLDTQEALQVVASEHVRTDVFTQLEPVGKEEAWAILVDASKSISTFSHEVKGIVTCLSEVAKDLIPKQKQWAVYSFNNSFQIIKDFSEDYGITSKARIGGLAQRNVTLLPDALRVAHSALSALPLDVRILVVVSDGYPTGYQDIEKNLITTIKEISRSGVLLMGVGIDSRAIEEYFTVNCVLDNPYQMMKSFVKSYLELSSLF